TRKLPTPGGRLSCTRENDPVRDSSGKQHINKCLMCAEKFRLYCNTSLICGMDLCVSIQSGRVWT
uniref:Kazal-like domain-containing protein n=1 Tax=Aquila chrysaetos chrysaetos TaxID=223781 RepID=A0A663FGP8_AQUCH